LIRRRQRSSSALDTNLANLQPAQHAIGVMPGIGNTHLVSLDLVRRDRIGATDWTLAAFKPMLAGSRFNATRQRR